MRSESSGLIVPPACRAWPCEVCGPRLMMRAARAIDAAGYDTMWTFTKTPTDWRQGMARLRHRLAREYGKCEWVYAREAGRRTGMKHVHAMVRAPFMDHGRVVHHARRAGFGRVTWFAKGSKAGAYAAKGGRAAIYASKGVEGSWGEVLALNDGRGWHMSQGYTHGEPWRSFVARNAPPDDVGPWVPVRRSPATGEWEPVMVFGRKPARMGARGAPPDREKVAARMAEVGHERLVVRVLGAVPLWAGA